MTAQEAGFTVGDIKKATRRPPLLDKWSLLIALPFISYIDPIMAITIITSTANTTTSQLCIDFLIDMAHLLYEL